eukprot:scaffold208159_cov18-Tisochrysis_lutea.AAC.1
MQIRETLCHPRQMWSCHPLHSHCCCQTGRAAKGRQQRPARGRRALLVERLPVHTFEVPA